MKTRPFRRAICCALLAAALGAGGCAVLTVDVDVYKGTLANHTDVQMEQMAAMAIGARPLLAELERVLEVKIEEQEANPKKKSSEYRRLREAVREVMRLYNDLSYEELQERLDRCREANAEFNKAYRKFYPPDSSHGRAVWQGLLKSDLPSHPDPISEPHKELKEAYRNFFEVEGEFREWRAVLRAHDRLWNSLPPEQREKRLRGLEPTEVAPYKGAEESSNRGFRELADRNLVLAHAKLLFQDENAQCAFVQEVTSIAEGFLEARKALSDLLGHSLRLHTAIGSRAAGSPVERRRALRTSGSLIVSLLQLAHVNIALSEIDLPETTSLRERLSHELPPCFKSFDLWNDSGHRREIESAITLVLIDNPEEASKALLEAHSLFPGVTPTGKSVPDKYRCVARRRYGLARGPSSALGEMTGTHVEQMVASVVREIPTLLNVGRLDEGLSRMTREFLVSTNDPSASESERERQTERLLGALMRFAEKLLVMANYYNLVEDPTAPDPKDLRERYVRVLQAVGNSILVQADALRQEETSEQRLEDTAKVELEALQHALNISGLEWAKELQRETQLQIRAHQASLSTAQEEIDSVREAVAVAKKNCGATLGRLAFKPAPCPPYAANLTTAYGGMLAAHRLFACVADDSNCATLMDRTRAEEALKAAVDACAGDPNLDILEVLAKELRDCSDVLKKAAEYFDAKEPGAVSCDDEAECKKTIRELICGDHASYHKDLKVAGEAEAIHQNLKELEGRCGELQAAKKKLESQKRVLQRAKKHIDEIVANVEKQVKDPNAASPSAQQVYADLLCAVRSSTATTDEKEHVLRFVVDRAPLGEPAIGQALAAGDYTAKDVRDLWITLLEYEHDLALRNGMTERARQIKAALDAARRKREGQIFLRPAMSYLRTSYPSTALQDNPNLTWDNQLGIQATRAIPFGPQLGHFFNPDAKRDARITAEIDKQFWQNINRVRVAGSGNTNYVVAKDDIGNWYVKGYSADPAPIIESAKNLALYSMSAQMGTDLLTAAPAEGDARPAKAGRTPPSRLESVYQKHRAAYEAEIEEQLDALYQSVDGKALRDEIARTWAKSETLEKYQKKLRGKLTESYRVLKADLAKIQKSTKTPAEEKIVEAVDRMSAFHSRLIWSVQDIRLASELTEKEATALEGLKPRITAVVEKAQREVLDRRHRQIRQYESRLYLLGDITELNEAAAARAP